MNISMQIGKSIADARTLPDLFRARIALTPRSVAYRQYDASAGDWVNWTWQQIGDAAELWRIALAAENFPAGSRIATLIPNSVAYVLVDQAALSLGLVIVPLHLTDNPENLAYILQDSGASALIIDDPAYWAQLAPAVAGLSGLKRVVVVSQADATDDRPIGGDARAVQASLWLRAAEARESIVVQVLPEMLAAIVYTSGTTGRPKGVMLSHRNVVSNVIAVLECVAPDSSDLFLSFLPLSHTFERTAGYYLPIAAGSAVAFSRSVALLSEDMRRVAPTILISVPRVYERAYRRIQENLAGQGSLAQWLFNLTERIGWRRFLNSQSNPPRRLPLLQRLLWPVLDRNVAAKIRAQFGGRLRVAVAGGAPMPEIISRSFLAVGINVLQGYGMTETSPVVSVNRLEHNDPATVGEVIPGVEVRIGENDELLVSGPNVMLGYWGRPEETRRVLTPDGWLHSGDQARMQDGRIVIKGRIKEIIVTSTGEKIAPADLEQAIMQDPLFEQVMVLGEQRPFIAAVAVLNRAVMENEARKLGISGTLDDSLNSDRVHAWVLARIKRAVAQFPSYATPRKIWLTLEPWTVSAGLMTPTLKLKRQAIERDFAKEIASFYEK